MKAPQPIFIVILMALLALRALSSPEDVGTGASGIGYLIGVLGTAVVISIAYIWWYRHREQT